jgi:AraC-like DNA-binding protein
MSDAMEGPQTVQLMVADALSRTRPTMERIAAEFGISGRTLQRRLHCWGLSFEDIVEETRHSRALVLIAEPHYAMVEIAFLLGYSDQAHFNRAFRRWTGMSPRAYQKHNHPMPKNKHTTSDQ